MINFNGRQSKTGFEGDGSFRDSGINGSIKQTAAKFKEPILLNQSSADELAQAEPIGSSGMKNMRNRESGTLGTSSNNYDAGDNMGDNGYDLDQNDR